MAATAPFEEVTIRLIEPVVVLLAGLLPNLGSIAAFRSV